MKTKHSLKIILLTALLIALLSVSSWAAVSYYMPYLHTNAANVIYCVVSNTSASTSTPSFTVTAASNAAPTSTVFTLSDVGSKTSKMITFSGTTAGGVSISGALGSTAENISYGGTLSFSTGDCNSILMSCFQGTTNPKRNVTGYNCNDGTNHYNY